MAKGDEMVKEGERLLSLRQTENRPLLIPPFLCKDSKIC